MLYRFDNVEKSYGPHDVLRGVTWQHNPGEHVGLVGRNGAGKTTLFRLLLKQEAGTPARDQVQHSIICGSPAKSCNAMKSAPAVTQRHTPR